MDRDLDGVYFRVERDGECESVCFSDLTEEQMRDVTGGRTNEWLRELCVILGKTIREIGDEFGIVSGGEESRTSTSSALLRGSPASTARRSKRPAPSWSRRDTTLASRTTSSRIERRTSRPCA